jgi:hypothetical protein
MPKEFTVDAEYWKYALGETSSEETNILNSGRSDPYLL